MVPSTTGTSLSLSISVELVVSGVGAFLPTPRIGPSLFPSEKLTERRCINRFEGVCIRFRLGSFMAETGVTLLLFMAERVIGVGTFWTRVGGLGVFSPLLIGADSRVGESNVTRSRRSEWHLCLCYSAREQSCRNVSEHHR